MGGPRTRATGRDIMPAKEGNVTGLHPGTVIGDQRYVTVRHLSEGADAEIWVAQDNTLDRLVTLLVIDLDSPEAPAVADAARRTAGVDNPRLVQVLDVGQEYDYVYVVEENLDDAKTMTSLIGRHGMAAEDVRRLTGEIALALEAGARRGLHHLGLTPDSVLVLADGRVKLAGLATQAAFAGLDDVDGKTALRRDTKGLVALAYAGLTGRWPYGGDAGLEPAPRIVGGVPRPSELAVGVPADLDTICHLTLNQDLGPISPADYAGQIAPWAALPGEQQAAVPDAESGDAAVAPSPEATQVLPVTTAPVPAGQATSTPDDPATTASPQTAPIRTGSAPGEAATAPAVAWVQPHTDAAAAPDVDGTLATGDGGSLAGSAATDGTAATGGTAARAVVGTAAAGVAAGGTAQATGAAAAAGATAAGATAAGVGAALAGGLGSASAAGKRAWARIGKAASSAGDAVRTAGTRAEDKVASHREFRAAVRQEEERQVVTIDEAPQQPEVEAPAPLLPAEAGVTPSRAQSRFVLATFAAATLVAGLLAGAVAFRSPDSSLEAILGPDASAPVSTTEPGSTSSSAPPAPGTEPLAISGAVGYDPEGDGAENNEMADRVYDEDLATYWQSEGYQAPNFGGLKSGVGLVIDMGREVRPGEIVLQLPNPSSLDLYLGSEADRTGANRIGQVNGESGEVRVPVSDGASGQYLIVWFTQSPQVADGRYRATLAEISLTG